MITSTHLQRLLTERPLVLWVEDTITKAYLERIWQPDDSLFQILVAGGNDSVGAVVHDLRDQGYDHVFRGMSRRRNLRLSGRPGTSWRTTCWTGRHWADVARTCGSPDRWSRSNSVPGSRLEP